MLAYLTVTECADWSVDRVGGTAGRENGHCWLLHSQCSTIRVDKFKRPGDKNNFNDKKNTSEGAGS